MIDCGSEDSFPVVTSVVVAVGCGGDSGGVPPPSTYPPHFMMMTTVMMEEYGYSNNNISNIDNGSISNINRNYYLVDEQQRPTRDSSIPRGRESIVETPTSGFAPSSPLLSRKPPLSPKPAEVGTKRFPSTTLRIPPVLNHQSSFSGKGETFCDVSTPNTSWIVLECHFCCARTLLRSPDNNNSSNNHDTMRATTSCLMAVVCPECRVPSFAE